MRFPKRLVAGLALLQVLSFIASRRFKAYLLSKEVGEDSVNAVAVTGGKKETVTSKSFTGGHARAVMGGLELDLTEASIDAPPAVLDVTVLCGGAMIWVPPEWKVRVEASSRLGDAKDLREDGAVAEGDIPDLVIRGSVRFGGLAINSH